MSLLLYTLVDSYSCNNFVNLGTIFTDGTTFYQATVDEQWMLTVNFDNWFRFSVNLELCYF